MNLTIHHKREENGQLWRVQAGPVVAVAGWLSGALQFMVGPNVDPVPKPWVFVQVGLPLERPHIRHYENGVRVAAGPYAVRFYRPW